MSVYEELIHEVGFNLAHQVRNPLGVIQSLTQSLAVSRRQRRADANAFAAIGKSIDSLNERLDEIVDFCKPLDCVRTPVRPAFLLESALIVTEAACRSRRVTLERSYYAGRSRMQADAQMLKTSLLHIIFNALEAMPLGGSLKVGCQRCEDIHGMVSLSVEDTGMGIKPENLKLVTHPFFTTKPDAAGLGLAVVKRVVIAHAGSLKIDSTLGKGTKVEMLLPTD
ncbi:MAG: ATP-binding protein [Elusimicrobiota bacterium]